MIKTADLIGAELDWYVAKLEGKPVRIINDMCIYVGPVDTWAPPGSLSGILAGQKFNPSVRHGIGGLIMDREKISTNYYGVAGVNQTWHASTPDYAARGPTRLIAAMRCYVSSKLGNEVPDIVDDYEVIVQVM